MDRQFLARLLLSVWSIPIIVCGIPLTSTPTSATTLGVIGNGVPTIKHETLQLHDYNISIVWYYIDIREVYQIYRAIHLLDEDDHVDVIMMFDYNPMVLQMPQLLETKYKTLIKWGEKIPDSMDEGIQVGQQKVIADHDICGEEVIPALMYDDPYCMMDLNTSLSNNLTTNESLTVAAPKALTKLVIQLKWKTVFILHENATDREAADLSDRLSDNGVKFVIYNVDLVPDLHSVLLKVYDATVRFNSNINMVVLCRFHCARRIFRTANSFDIINTRHKTLLKQFSRWLVAVYGHSMGVSHALQACADDLDNVVIIGIPEFSGAGKEDLYTLIKSLATEVYGSQLIEPEIDMDLKEYFITHLQEAASSWNPTTKCRGYNIDTLLWAEHKARSFSSVGYVDLSGNIVVTNDIFPNTNYGYNKRTFMVSTLPYAPFVLKKTVNGTAIYQGMVMDLLEELARTLNFSYVISEPADGLWGAYKDEEKETWNGLMGQLQNEEVDMVAAPLSIQTNRERVVDFIYPFFYEYTTVVTKKPDNNATKWRTLVDPFKWQVLLSIGFALLTVTVIVYLLEKYNPYYDTPGHSEDRQINGGLNHLHNAFWYMYGALLCQGGVHLPDSVAGRTFISCWWIFCIIIVGTYCGNLIAFLTVSKTKPPFNTLEEMVKLKDQYKWGTLGGTNWETLFTTSQIPIYKEVGDGMKEFNRTDPNILNTDPDYHIQRVIQGKYAWIGDKTYIEVSMATECGLIKIKDEFLPMKYAFAFPNNSPHIQIFSKQMMNIHEGGLLQIWKRKWWPKASFCRSETVTEAKPISVIDVQSAFYVCVAGIFFGTVAFICELSIVHCRKFRRRRRDKKNNNRET